MQCPLREFRCPDCHKLLCKGLLNASGCILEVKCRGCGKISTFEGHDAEIIQKRSVLISQGLIPDTDTSEA